VSQVEAAVELSYLGRCRNGLSDIGIASIRSSRQSAAHYRKQCGADYSETDAAPCCFLQGIAPHRYAFCHINPIRYWREGGPFTLRAAAPIFLFPASRPHMPDSIVPGMSRPDLASAFPLTAGRCNAVGHFLGGRGGETDLRGVVRVSWKTVASRERTVAILARATFNSATR
jgi:hypothetical protein